MTNVTPMFLLLSFSVFLPISLVTIAGLLVAMTRGYIVDLFKSEW